MDRATKPEKRSTAKAILDAAIDQIEQFGVEGMRIEKVLADASSSTGSMRHHFGSRAGLVEAAQYEIYGRTLLAESTANLEAGLAATTTEGQYEAEDRGTFSEELDEEQELLTNLTDAIGQLLKLHGEAIMPVMDATVAPLYAPFLGAEQPEALQIVAVCMIDDVLEFGGGAAVKYMAR